MDTGLVKPSKYANYANYAYLSHIYFLIDFNQFDYAVYEYSVRMEMWYRKTLKMYELG